MTSHGPCCICNRATMTFISDPPDGFIRGWYCGDHAPEISFSPKKTSKHKYRLNRKQRRALGKERRAR